MTVPPAVVSSPGRSPAPHTRVLVVDDIEANRDILVRRLARLGITNVVQAVDGRAALDVIRSTDLDLVLLDIMMPIMTGFDVLEALAAEGRIERLPVIVISAMDEMQAIVRAISLGAEDFLLKPFDPTLLRARILPTLEKKQLRDQVRAELVRKQAELAEARSLQMALTPPRYADARLAIDAVLEPAREVGGDLVDHAVLADGRHLLVVGDVSDKGAGAALVMARTHALTRGLATPAATADLAAVAGALNGELSRGNESCTFVTMLLGVFDPAQGRFDYVRCGHLPPFLRRAGGAVERLDAAGGMALGIDASGSYAAASVALTPGDRLLVVDDNDDDRSAITRTLAASGYDVTGVASGAAAIEWLDDNPAPALLLLDLIMPGMDGFALLDHIRHDATLRQIKVLVMTAKDLTANEEGFLLERGGTVIPKGADARAALIDALKALHA